MSLSRYSKAIVALILAALQIAALWWPNAGLVAVEEVERGVSLFLTLLTPLLVYLVPNKPAS